MLATFIPAGQGSSRSRKFSTVDELVKVIRSAPSAEKRRRAPVASRVSENGSIRKRFVYNRTHAAQFFGEQVPRLLCPGDQNPQVFNPTLLLKFLYHRFSHKLFRLQIDVKMEIPHSLRRRLARWPQFSQRLSHAHRRIV